MESKQSDKFLMVKAQQAKQLEAKAHILGTKFMSLTSRKKGKKGKKGGGLGAQPPELNAQVSCNFKGYYYTAGVTNAACTRATIAGAMGAHATSATTLISQPTSFKIKRITVWSSSVAGNTNDSFVYWAASTGEQALIKDDVKIKPVVGGTVPAGPMTFTPPKGSYASMWQRVNAASSPSETIFQVTMGSGSVLLLEAEFTLGASIEALLSPGAALGLTTGSYYRYSLDTTSTGNVVKSFIASAF